MIGTACKDLKDKIPAGRGQQEVGVVPPLPEELLAFSGCWEGLSAVCLAVFNNVTLGWLTTHQSQLQSQDQLGNKNGTSWSKKRTKRVGVISQLGGKGKGGGSEYNKNTTCDMLKELII